LVDIASKKPHLVPHSLYRCATTSLNYDDSRDQTACIRRYINLIPVTKTPVLDTSCFSTLTVNGRIGRISASYSICEILDLNFGLEILPGISNSCYNLQTSIRIVGLSQIRKRSLTSTRSPNHGPSHHSVSSGSSSADSQEIPRTLQNPKFNCRVYNSPPIVPIMSQLNPIHTLPTEFFKIYYIIFPSTSRSSRRSVSPRYSHQNLISTYLRTYSCYMPCSSHSS
jgi:hypothetical protein